MKLIKAIILLPMWPLIWYSVGFELGECRDRGCVPCGIGINTSGCCRRAKAMVEWYRGKHL